MISELPPSLEEGVVVLDPRSTILDVNDAFARMIGIPRELLVGASTALLAPGGGSLPPEQCPVARVERTGECCVELRRLVAEQLETEDAIAAVAHRGGGFARAQ